MVEVYRVGVTLRLIDEATPALGRLIGALNAAGEQAEKLKVILSDLAGTRLAGLSRSILGLDRRLSGVGATAKAMADSIVGSFDKLDTGVIALRGE